MGTPSVPKEVSPLRAAALWLFLTAFAATALVHHAVAGWNANTRLNLVYAIVHGGTFNIDAWHDVPPHETMDKAYFEGHFYSDKTWGVSLLALPVGWALNHLPHPPQHQWQHYWMRLFAVGIPAAASVSLFFLIVAGLGVPPRRAAVLSILGFLGSMWYGYATVFFPYAPGIACVLGALYLTLHPPRGRLEQRECAAIGFLLGYALLCDLIFNIAVAGVGMVWLLRLIDQTGIGGMRSFAEMKGETTPVPRAIRLAVVFWIFVLIPLGAFAAYCYHIFGTISLPYQYEFKEEFREGMSRGIMGVTAPKLDVLYYITVHPLRGIFFWTPLTAISIAGCVMGTRRYGKRRMLAWLGLWAAAGYLTFNSGYFLWWGGWCMGPRFLIPMIPLLLIGASEFAQLPVERRGVAPSPWTRYLWPVALVAGIAGVLLSMPLSLTEPQTVTPPIAALTTVPQYGYLKWFYSFRVLITLEAGVRDDVVTKAPSLEVAFYLVLKLGLVAALFYRAWKSAPEKTPFSRIGYPLRTVDGSIRPQPV